MEDTLPAGPWSMQDWALLDVVFAGDQNSLRRKNLYNLATVSLFLTERIENLGTLREKSSYQHYLSVIEARQEISGFSTAEYLLGTLKSPTAASLPETYYLRTLYVRGVLSLAVLFGIIGLSLWEAHGRYRAAAGDRSQRGLFLGALVAISSFAFASLFIPYFDTFPSNFYFWFLVAIVWCEPEVRPKRKAPEAAIERRGESTIPFPARGALRRSKSCVAGEENDES